MPRRPVLTTFRLRRACDQYGSSMRRDRRRPRDDHETIMRRSCDEHETRMRYHARHSDIRISLTTNRHDDPRCRGTICPSNESHDSPLTSSCSIPSTEAPLFCPFRRRHCAADLPSPPSPAPAAPSPEGLAAAGAAAAAAPSAAYRLAAVAAGPVPPGCGGGGDYSAMPDGQGARVVSDLPLRETRSSLPISV